MTYSAEITAEAEKHPNLGGEYFAAHAASERFMATWKEEHAEKFADDIMKPVMDMVMSRVWDAFREFMMADAEQNVADEMRRMVESSVKALIGGDRWANVKYISPEGYGTDKVRATLAKLYSDEIKDGRIADLEREVERLSKDLAWYRQR